MADQCPTCSCETNGDHTCPHTKAPTTRALADDLWLTRQDVARLDSLVGKCEDRLEALERAHTNGVGGCTGDQRDTPTDPAAWPADSALPPKPNLPNEPSYLDLGAALNQWQVRCNALESRLAETEARLAKAEATISIAGARHAYVLDTELKADRLERECREIGEKLAAMQADRDALKAKLAEASEERSKAVLALEGAWGHQKNLEATLARVEKSSAEELRIKLTKEQADREAQRARAEKAEKRIADLESDRSRSPSAMRRARGGERG